jgi:superfamily II DNA or RNA helicase
LSIQDVYAILTKDDARNRQIASDVCSAVEAGRCPLVLTGRTEHLSILADLIRPRVPELLILRGGMGKRQRLAASQSLAASPDEAPQVILATGSYIGEGFDYPRLDTLFLAMPISWKGTLQQYAGRLHRLHTGKQQVEVHDYTDSGVPMLARMFERRLKGYRDMGYEVQHGSRS